MTTHWNSPVEGITMTLGLAFWIIMLVWLVFGGLVHFGLVSAVYVGVSTLLLFVLFTLLGWQLFGPPLRR